MILYTYVQETAQTEKNPRIPYLRDLQTSHTQYLPYTDADAISIDGDATRRDAEIPRTGRGRGRGRKRRTLWTLTLPALKYCRLFG
ncbi:MAG: hypothetical protein ACRDF4_04755 [Rhabdochlamydiaceae bacterium]